MGLGEGSIQGWRGDIPGAEGDLVTQVRKSGFPFSVSVWCQEASLPNNPSSEAQTGPNHPLIFHISSQPLHMLQRVKREGFLQTKPYRMPTVRRHRRLHVGRTDVRQWYGPGTDTTLAVLRSGSPLTPLRGTEAHGCSTQHHPQMT